MGSFCITRQLSDAHNSLRKFSLSIKVCYAVECLNSQHGPLKITNDSMLDEMCRSLGDICEFDPLRTEERTSDKKNKQSDDKLEWE